MASKKPTVDDIAAATPPEDESLWERRMRFVTMRNAGRTYQQIADASTQAGVPVSVSTVRKDVMRAYKEIIAESRDEMIARQRSVILDMQRTNYLDAINTDPDKIDARVAAQKQIMSGLEHEAKLFGLYAPAQVHLGISDTEFATETARLISELGLKPPTELTSAISRRVDENVLEGEVIEPEAVPAEAKKATPFDSKPQPEVDTPWSNL